MTALAAVDPHLGEAEKEARRKGLGASEISAVVGLNRFANAAQIWAKKLGLIPDSVGEPALWGNILEPVIAAEYARREGVQVVPAAGVWTDEGIPGQAIGKESWMRARPDFRGIAKDGTQFLVEVKAPGFYQKDRWGPTGSDEVPEEYFVQAQWQMHITGDALCVIACLIAGQELRWFPIAYDEAFASILEDAGRAFWNDHILTGVEPDLEEWIPHARLDYLAKRFPSDDGSMLDGAPMEDLLEDLVAARDVRKAAEEHEAALEGRVKASIGDAAGVKWKGGSITWKAAKDSQKVDYVELLEAIRLELQDRKAAIAIIDAQTAKHTTVRKGSRRFLVKVND